MGQTKQTQKYEGYFESLPKNQLNMIRILMENTIDQVEGWKSTDDCFESIECHSRSGFICASDNKGGLTACQFTDLYSLWGSGTSVSHKGAQAEIERQIEYSLKCDREAFFRDNTDGLKAIGIESADRINYHELTDKGQDKLADKFAEYEHEHMQDDENSIMFEVRFMYHGTDENGLHSASVSCAVNTEGPYHRSSIAWAPKVFCEGAKEVEITWRTVSGLRQKLQRALKLTSGEVF